MKKNNPSQGSQYKEDVLINGHNIISCLQYLQYELYSLNFLKSVYLIDETAKSVEKEIERMRDS